MHTDACLGFRATGYWSWGNSRDHRDARRLVFIRNVGLVAEGHGASPATISRKAKVGFCPCCARPTRIAISPTFD